MSRTHILRGIRFFGPDVDALATIRAGLDKVYGGDCQYNITELVRFALAFTADAFNKARPVEEGTSNDQCSLRGVSGPAE